MEDLWSSGLVHGFQPGGPQFESHLTLVLHRHRLDTILTHFALFKKNGFLLKGFNLSNKYITLFIGSKNKVVQRVASFVTISSIRGKTGVQNGC